MSAAALRLDSFADVDPLDQPDTVEVLGRNLRDGMVVVDDLGAPSAGLDHKVTATRGSGSVRFLCHDLDTGRIVHHEFHRNRTFRVVAR